MYKPLYRIVRPHNIEEVVGQEHLIGPEGPLRKLIDKGRIPSMLFFGPPGTGKTLIAEIMANRINAHFVKLSGVDTGVQEIKRVIHEAKQTKRWGKNTVVFIDEIHRLNRAQQDLLLPPLEDGAFILVGASTENPLFALRKALVSRLLVFEFNPLSKEDLRQILSRALEKLNYKERLSEEALSLIAKRAGGDARKALSMLELILETYEDQERIEQHHVEKALGETSYIRYNEDEHYNVISAFIKSIRGSDPDAALYWLSVMLEAGEDPLYITRRLIILAAEDVGLADPFALTVATSAHHAVSHIGLPEGELVLAFATLYLATAFKSNSAYEALKKAKEFVKSHPDVQVPVHLMDPMAWQKRSSKEKYLYPHRFPEGFVKQRYMPHDEVFYIPKHIGHEKKIAERLRSLWNERYSKRRDAQKKGES